MKYSIITPSFNQGQFLEKTIQSVLEQDIADFEHIIADGGSTDSTLDVIQRHPHLIWFSERDRGQSDALNKALARARGEWIVWINSDDYLLPGALKALDAFLIQKPDAQFVYSSCLYVDEHGRELKREPASWTSDNLVYWWRRGLGFSQPGSFFRRELWERYGPFGVDLHYTMDYDFWLKMHREVRFDTLDAFTAAYRLQPESKTCTGNYKFVLEKIAVTRAYWDRQGGPQAARMRKLMTWLEARETVIEATRLDQVGDAVAARVFLRRAMGIHPLALFIYPHICHRLQRLIGDTAYRRLRQLVRGSRRGTDTSR